MSYILNGSQVLMLKVEEDAFPPLQHQLKGFPSSLSKISNHFGAAATFSSHRLLMCPTNVGGIISQQHQGFIGLGKYMIE